ncbi:SRRM2 protein, partial [Acromyrmex insinuator]
MYNGIGLQTPRGSGTNGHVQRNWAIVRKNKDKVTYKMEESKADQLNKQPNKEILDHVRKRKVEVKCAEFADILENQGYTNEEITNKVEQYRSVLIGGDIKSSTPQDEFGRVKYEITREGGDAFRGNLGRIGGGQGRYYTRDIDVPHSAGAKRVRDDEGGTPGRRRTRSGRKRERSISLSVASFFQRLSARMDRRHDAASGCVVVCRRRRMVHRGLD